MKCKKCGKVNGLKIKVYGQPTQCYSCYKIKLMYPPIKRAKRVRRILKPTEF